MPEYAVVEYVKIVRHDGGGVSVWQEVAPATSFCIATHSTVEQAHTWLATEGYEPYASNRRPPELGGLYQYYYRLIPVVLL